MRDEQFWNPEILNKYACPMPVFKRRTKMRIEGFHFSIKNLLKKKVKNFHPFLNILLTD